MTKSPDYTGVVYGLVACLITVAVIGLVAWLISDAQADYKARNEFYKTNCTLIGTRITDGWGSTTVRMYKCKDGTTRER